jgi:hypothetical protein
MVTRRKHKKKSRKRGGMLKWLFSDVGDMSGRRERLELPNSPEPTVDPVYFDPVYNGLTRIKRPEEPYFNSDGAVDDFLNSEIDRFVVDIVINNEMENNMPNFLRKRIKSIILRKKPDGTRFLLPYIKLKLVNKRLIKEINKSTLSESDKENIWRLSSDIIREISLENTEPQFHRFIEESLRL